MLRLLEFFIHHLNRMLHEFFDLHFGGFEVATLLEQVWAAHILRFMPIQLQITSSLLVEAASLVQ